MKVEDVKKEKWDSLISSLTEMGVRYSQERYENRVVICAKINDVYDLSVRTEIDDDADEDWVVFSIRLNGELLRLDYDGATEFPVHLGIFMREIERRIREDMNTNLTAAKTAKKDYE